MSNLRAVKRSIPPSFLCNPKKIVGVNVNPHKFPNQRGLPMTSEPLKITVPPSYIQHYIDYVKKKKREKEMINLKWMPVVDSTSWGQCFWEVWILLMVPTKIYSNWIQRMLSSVGICPKCIWHQNCQCPAFFKAPAIVNGLLSIQSLHTCLHFLNEQSSHFNIGPTVTANKFNHEKFAQFKYSRKKLTQSLEW